MQAAPPSPPPGPSGSPTAGLRVLVVDDDEDTADMLEYWLRSEGHEVRTANTGSAALAVVDRFTPDVVLLDIGLPGMDGYEVAHRLRQRPSLVRTLFVAITGFGQPADRERTIRAGFHAHLVKPTRLDEIEKILRMKAASIAKNSGAHDKA